ncbi:unnamed protein product [Peniophora sp. CBMAI 1063]|nr:unnamed protein product [Peniophora sp. CBMAI 1063]
MLPLLTSVVFGLAALPHIAHAAVTTDPSLASNRTSDYIILGGGTAGLALAGRLSEDPDVSVLVIEAGPDNRTSALESVVDFPVALGSALDWTYGTVDGKAVSGGKTLGGSSSINGGTWTRGAKAQYDAFSALLEPEDADKGWDWDGLQHYMKKAERFAPPNTTQRALGATFEPEAHGTDGPVHAAFPTDMFYGPADPYFIDTISNITGIKRIPDASGGNPNGVVYVPDSLNKFDNDSRSSSAAAYLTPVEHARTNWLTLVEHTATRILFAPSNTSASASSSPSQSNLTATSVQFAATPPVNSTSNIDEDAAVFYTAHATREVILAAGALRTPALLQLSGIGDAALLESLGIDVLLDLKGVGKNLQEQTNAVMAAVGNGEFEAGGLGPNSVIALPSIYDLFGANASAKIDEMNGSLDTWAEEQAHNFGAGPGALLEVFKVQAGLIANDSAPIAELFYDVQEAPDTLIFALWNLLPFSRGNVFISTTNPFLPPSININWFTVPFDLTVQIAAARLARAVFSTPPLNSLVDGFALPTEQDVPENASDAQWASWMLSNFGANSHPIGTAAMLRRTLGGVVDASLKVYGTANVRVVDASILPIQLSAHLSGTVYGVAEKAGDIIKAAHTS